MLNQMSKGDKAASAGAIALLISLFLPWFGINTGSAVMDNMLEAYGALSWNAFKAFGIVDIALVLIAVAVVAVLVLIAMGKLDDSLRQPLESVGGVATVIVAWNLFDSGKLDAVSIKYGGYLAFLGALAISVGGFLNRKDGVV